MPNQLFFVFFVSTLLLICSLLMSKSRVGFYLLISCFIYLTSFLWIPLNFLAGEFVGTPILTDDIKMAPLWGATLFYGVFVFIAGVLCLNIKVKPLPVFEASLNQVILLCSFAFFILSISAYIALNGMSFSAGNYGQRLTANAGNGIFMIFFFLFIPASYLILIQRPSYSRMFIALTVCVLGGMLVYFTLGGSRNVLAAGVLGVIILSQRLKMLSLVSIFGVALLLIILVNYLAFVRYGQDLSDDVLTLGFRYLIDSLSPYDSFNRIVIFFESGDQEFKGFEYIMAQFNPLIPRSFWPDKPVVPLTNAFFFTESVLGIKAGTYIISPTLLGGLFIMGGWSGVCLGLIFLVALTIYLENLLFSNSPFGVLFSYILLPFSFFMVRESIELFVNKGILKLFTFIFIVAVSVLFLTLLNSIDKKMQNIQS